MTHRGRRGATARSEVGSGSKRAVPRPTLGFRIVAWVVIALVGTMRWRVRTDGLDNLPPDRGAVVTWNHHSHVDFLLTMWDVYRRLDRSCRYLAKRELWDSPWVGWVPRFAGAVPVDRRPGIDRARAPGDAVVALGEGHLVMVAPEGTISPSFELMRFKRGAVRMAQLAGVPVVPSVSWGSHRLSTSGHPLRLRRAWRIPVTVRFGPPIEIGPDEDLGVATERVRSAMCEMLDEVQREYPDGTPAGAWWVPARFGGGAPAATDVVGS